MIPMIPWFKGFEGKVELSPTDLSDNTQYLISGVIAKFDCKSRRVTITELPIGLWTHEYKSWLDEQQWIQSVKDLSESSGKIHLEVTLSNDAWLADEGYLMKKLELIRTFSLSDMHASNPCGNVVKYENPLEIIMDFASFRLAYYIKRKADLLADINSKLMSNMSDIENFIGITSRSSKGIKHWMSKLKESPETAKLSNLSDLLYDKLKMINKDDFVKRATENDVVTLLGRAVTLRQSPRIRGQNNLSEDDYLALETVCNALKKVSAAISKIRELCTRRNDLKRRLSQLQKEDGLSLWLKDLDQLELCFKVE
ncbi:hypothetical protein SOVF_068910 isoform B [Spinacia oleracea]|nr:hypothetical protein SOVF_068910 isoform B [Spinacia oleracea]